MSFWASKKGSGYLYERDKLTTREQRKRAADEELPLRQTFDDVCREAPTKSAEQVSFANSDTRFALVSCGHQRFCLGCVEQVEQQQISDVHCVARISRWCCVCFNRLTRLQTDMWLFLFTDVLRMECWWLRT